MGWSAILNKAVKVGLTEQRLDGGEAISHMGLSEENSRWKEWRMQMSYSDSIPGMSQKPQGSQCG